MLNVAQRIDLMKLAVEVAKAELPGAGDMSPKLLDRAVDIFATIRSVVESGSALDDTNMNDVKTAVDIASELESLVD